MNGNSNRAKEIFLKYCGSYFHMTREGDYDEYKKYKISKEQEYEWIQEYQKEQLLLISNDEVLREGYFNLCDSISEYRNVDCLKELVEIALDRSKIFDTFSTLLMAEGILSIVEHFEKRDLGNHKITVFAKQSALNILRWLLDMPVTVAPKYIERLTLFDVTDNQKIIDRINEDLESWS